METNKFQLDFNDDYHKIVKFQFNQAIDESQMNNFAALSNYRFARPLMRPQRTQCIIEDLIWIVQENVFGQSVPFDTRGVSSKTGLDKEMKDPLESMDALEGSRDKTYNLMYIFNQLMTHQCLLNMSYAQNVIYNKKVR